MAGTELIAQGIQRRRDLMKFVKDYLKREGMSPSVEDVATHLGITKTAVRNHIGILVDEGLLETTPGRYRSLRVPAKAPEKRRPKAI